MLLSQVFVSLNTWGQITTHWMMHNFLCHCARRRNKISILPHLWHCSHMTLMIETSNVHLHEGGGTLNCVVPKHMSYIMVSYTTSYGEKMNYILLSWFNIYISTNSVNSECHKEQHFVSMRIVMKLILQVFYPSIISYLCFLRGLFKD